MKWLKEIIAYWRTKNEVVERQGKEILKDETPMGWNIYTPENMTRKEYAKEFHKVHKDFKYKLIVPGMILAERFALPKYKHNVVDNNIYNREMLVFENSYNQAMEDMATIYDLEYNIKHGITSEDAIKKVREDREAFRYLKTAKQSILYITQMDGWYHEFSVFLMHRIYANMAKEFDGQVYNRIPYTSKSVADVHWIMMQKQIQQEVKLTMTDATKYLKTQNDVETKKVLESAGIEVLQ